MQTTSPWTDPRPNLTQVCPSFYPSNPPVNSVLRAHEYLCLDQRPSRPALARRRRRRVDWTDPRPSLTQVAAGQPLTNMVSVIYPTEERELSRSPRSSSRTRCRPLVATNRNLPTPNSCPDELVFSLRRPPRWPVLSQSELAASLRSTNHPPRRRISESALSDRLASYHIRVEKGRRRLACPTLSAPPTYSLQSSAQRLYPQFDIVYGVDRLRPSQHFRRPTHRFTPITRTLSSAHCMPSRCMWADADAPTASGVPRVHLALPAHDSPKEKQLHSRGYDPYCGI